MIDPLVHIAFALVALAATGLVVLVLGALATLRQTARRALREPTQWPSLSLLKPIKGLEEELEENLRSLFVSDYPGALEVVFAAEASDDPALAVARRVAAEHPHVPVRYVVSSRAFGQNPKVANLAGALAAAAHDLVLQTDANVRAPSDYLRRIVSEFLASDASLLSSLVVGTGERSVGAAMENLQLSAMIIPSVCFAKTFFRVTCVIGKSMLLRRSEFEALGGLELVKDVLAEDFLLGRIYEDAGRRVILSSTVVANHNAELPISRVFDRHARWLKMRAVIHPPAFVAELVANPVGLSFLALLLSGFDARVAAVALPVVLAKVLLDLAIIARTRGTALSVRYAWVGVPKDLMLLAVWAYAAVSRTVTWRGRRFRLAKGSALIPLDDAPDAAWSEALGVVRRRDHD